MKASIILGLLVLSQVVFQNPAEQSPVVIISFKWLKDRQPIQNAASVSMAPAPAMIGANKNFEKQRRANAPIGELDPNSVTVDGRAAQLEQIVQESRAAEPVSGFSYQLKVQNGSGKPIEIVFWEYRFKAASNPQNVTRRQFLCSVQIKPEKQKDMQAFSLKGPSDVIHVKSLAKDAKFEEAVLINRVEFGDGSSWQRDGWSLEEVKLTAKARDKRNLPSCRGL